MPEDKWLDQHLLPFECCWAEASQGVLWGRGLQQGQARPRQSSRKQGWAHTARAPHRLGIPNTWNSLELSSGFHKAKSFVSGGLATASSPAQHSNLACSALSDQYSTQERGKKPPEGSETPSEEEPPPEGTCPQSCPQICSGNAEPTMPLQQHWVPSGKDLKSGNYQAVLVRHQLKIL